MTASRRLLAGALLCAAIGLLAACAPDGTTPPPPASPSGSASGTPTGTPTASPTPSPTTTTVSLPTDCRALLSPAVLAELEGFPLNDPAVGPDAGVQPDGSLHCYWGSPSTDTGRLVTEISRMNRGPALDMLNQLQSTAGFTCYTPDGGTRCEKTWPDPDYPVTDGRTLFWRGDVLVDTRYAGLAPSGYTSSIVAALFG
jgi:hypothetical protein